MIKISYLEGNKLFMLQIFIRVTSLLSLILLSQSWLIFLDISWIKLINIPNKFPQYVNEFDSTNISHCDNTNRYNNDFTLRKYLKSKQLITSQIGKLIIILLSWCVAFICKQGTSTLPCKAMAHSNKCLVMISSEFMGMDYGLWIGLYHCLDLYHSRTNFHDQEPNRYCHLWVAALGSIARTHPLVSH